MKFCCRSLEEVHANAGSQEFGLSTARYGNELVFVLQHRALDPDALPPFTEFPMSIVSELLLSYCPGGVNLQKFYRDQMSEFGKSELKLGMDR